MMQLTGWNVTRWLRLVLAITFLIAGIASNDTVAYVASVLFAAQAVFNIGCCGMPVCQPGTSSSVVPDLKKDVSYTEIQ